MLGSISEEKNKNSCGRLHFQLLTVRLTKSLFWNCAYGCPPGPYAGNRGLKQHSTWWNIWCDFDRASSL